MSYDVLPEIRCQCGHLKTDHLWSMHGKVKRCQKKKCYCLKFIEHAKAQAGQEGCHHEWGTDGAHSNEFCKKCFQNKAKG